MRATPLVLAVTALSACWTERTVSTVPHATVADPVREPSTEPNYRDVTLVVDAIGVGLLAAGTYGYTQRGGNDALSSGLFLAGGLTAALGAPLVHGLHHHVGRAGASYALRSMFVSAGVIAGMSASCAQDHRAFCGLDPLPLSVGMIGGFAVAGALDALLLHGASSTWTPTVTPDEGGARVGIAKLF